MSKHIVFLLHGMGQHQAGWSSEGINQFQKVAKSIGYPETFSTYFEFVEINYNHLFDQYLEQHKEQSESLSAFVEKSSNLSRSSFYKGLYDYASEVPDSDDFVVTSLGDVFLYRATEYASAVTGYVKEQISKTLNNSGDVLEWSLLGHSLGARVAHDALEELLMDDDFMSTFDKPSCIGMIANVSLLLAYRPSTLWAKSSVFPHDRQGHGGCYRYVNAVHPLDPFMWIRPFLPPTHWGGGAVDGTGYINAGIDENDLRRANPHSFAGYLENPAVAAALCQGLGTRSAASKPYKTTKLAAAVAQYKAQTINGQAQAVRNAAVALRDRPSPSGFKSLVSTLRAFETMVNGFSDSLTGEDK